MTDTVNLETSAKASLEELARDIANLLVHAQSVPKDRPPTCWAKNNEELDVALTILCAAASSINDAVTRFNLVFKSNPGDVASESMAKEMGDFCEKMVASSTLLGSVGASDSMTSYFWVGVRGVLRSLQGVVSALLDPTRHSQINSLTGMVWRACEDLQQAPKTNKLACRRRMMQWSVTIKDTVEEFQEAVNTAASNCTTDGEGSKQDPEELEQQMGDLNLGADGLHDDFDLDDMDKEYNTSELQCVKLTIDVLQLLRRCLKAANEYLNTIDSGGGSHHEDSAVVTQRKERLRPELEWVQLLLGSLSKANECAGEMGVLLYPPLDGSELLARSNDLGRTLVEFFDVFERRERQEGEKRVDGTVMVPSPLRAQVDEKMDSLRSSLSQI